MKMSRIPFEVKTVYVILVVISQGGNSGFINNEAENLGKALFVGGFLLLLFFSFFRRNNLNHLEYGVFWHLETLASLETAIKFVSGQIYSSHSRFL